MHERITFVGRGLQLQRLHEELAAAAGGQERVTLVEGPAGIGKSTLIERFLASVPDGAVLRASGDDSETAVVFGIVDQLLRQAARRATHAPADPPGGHVEAGVRLLEALDELLADGPVIVLVDDAHWADAESLKALLFVVRRVVDEPVLVVLAVRPGQAAGLPEADAFLTAHERIAADRGTRSMVARLARVRGERPRGPRRSRRGRTGSRSARGRQAIGSIDAVSLVLADGLRAEDTERLRATGTTVRPVS